MAGPARSEAQVATPKAQRYLAQLCKHFEHRLLGLSLGRERHHRLPGRPVPARGRARPARAQGRSARSAAIGRARRRRHAPSRALCLPRSAHGRVAPAQRLSQSSTRRRAIESRRGRRRASSSDARQQEAALVPLGVFQFLGIDRDGAASGARVKSQHERGRERPGLRRVIGHLVDRDAGLLEHLARDRLLEALARLDEARERRMHALAASRACAPRDSARRHGRA